MGFLSIISLNFEEWSRSSSAFDDEDDEEESPPPGPSGGMEMGWSELEHWDGKVNSRRDLGSNSEVVLPALGLGGRLLLFGISCSSGRRHLM